MNTCCSCLRAEMYAMREIEISSESFLMLSVRFLWFLAMLINISNVRPEIWGFKLLEIYFFSSLWMLSSESNLLVEGGFKCLLMRSFICFTTCWNRFIFVQCLNPEATFIHARNLCFLSRNSQLLIRRLFNIFTTANYLKLLFCFELFLRAFSFL